MPDPKEQTISASFISHLRQQSRLSCPLGCGDTFVANDERIRDHFKTKHSDYLEGKDIAGLIRDVKKGRHLGPTQEPLSTRDPGGGPSGVSGAADAGSSSQRPKHIRAQSTSPPRRSRARAPQDTPTFDPDFQRGTQQGKLWNPEEGPSGSAARARPSSSSKPPKTPTTPRRADPPEEDSSTPRLIKQPETRPISQEQLVAEVKGIYAGLMMVESKCIEVDNAQSSQNDTKLNNEQWQALIALHRTLLHEHHDFFLASQHPSASPALKRLASKMAIEDEDIRDREVWTSVSRHWYSKASDKAPTTGRLYHHLAILARPNALQQLFYYTKALCVPIPFASAKESIMTLFDPLLVAGGYQQSRLAPIDLAFVKSHGILFSRKQLNSFRPAADEFLGLLNNHIGRLMKRWMEAGYYIAIANCCGLLSYGREENVIMKLIHNQGDENQPQPVGSGTGAKPSSDLENPLYLAMGTHEVVFHRRDDVHVLPYVHVVMVFMFYLVRLPNALQHVEHLFPWELLSLLLNELLNSYDSYDRIRSDEFPRETNDPPRPIPEDFALKGLGFVDNYYPPDWFSNDKIDDDEKYFEMASMTDVRKERILWLGYKMAQSGSRLTYDEDTNRFGVIPTAETEGDAMDVDETR
ncbi:hypothetical protein EKO27_g11668 [Xylaria grammica]|uniref:DNA/RNA-binding domain-containing protein n=1 Tax=Xylaria grammica TaxID=363999 RepID=A0A439CMP7_9PEZI|nr:hypothetical protein EKO27_g11668 [Xylaria grammica]